MLRACSSSIIISFQACSHKSGAYKKSGFAFKPTCRSKTDFFGKQIACHHRSSIQRFVLNRNHHFRPSATISSLFKSQIASNAFTLGTIAVLPFYTLMILAPNAQLTKRSVESSLPFVILGGLYAYLLCLSWTPHTLRLMFASKYWLPELHGIAKMFSSEMTLASAWVHLLVVDLFAARQIFCDGLKNNIETRHSIFLCLLFCPIGIVMHAATKVLKKIMMHKKAKIKDCDTVEIDLEVANIDLKETLASMGEEVDETLAVTLEEEVIF